MPPGQSVSEPASPDFALPNLGWSAFFADQIEPDETGLTPCRIAIVHRGRMAALTPAGPMDLTLPVHTNIAAFAVGDWVLAEPLTHLLHRCLARKTVLERRSEGARTTQLAAANVDTLFIVTACNADFSVPRLERYLALANQAGTAPIIVLTKADKADDPQAYRRQAQALQRDLPVLMLDPRLPQAASILAPWCASGQTIAVIGSSGVGKSTLVNTLVGPVQAVPQRTGGTRQGDDKGRHTTTARSLHAIAGGGWVIDTPGIRTLHVSALATGIDILFAEITELAPSCKFRDCSHAHEPGCAVQAAIKAGTLDPERLDRWRKMSAENRGNSPGSAGTRRGKKR